MIKAAGESEGKLAAPIEGKNRRPTDANNRVFQVRVCLGPGLHPGIGELASGARPRPGFSHRIEERERGRHEIRSS